MTYEKAELGRRFFAALADGLLAGLLGLVPLIGGFLALAYMLTKDAVWSAAMSSGDWEGRSFGKRLMGLKVIKVDGGRVDFGVSIMRNLPIVAGSIVALIPLLGWFLAPIVSLALLALEIFLIVTDSKGRRFGDRWAETVVIQSH